MRFVNSEAAELSGEHVAFSFGSNWARYLRDLTEERVAAAKASLVDSFGGAAIEGTTFVDVGSGSGLFSLAAHRLGARSILSMDVDPTSIACVRALWTREGAPSNWEIVRGSVLDRAVVRDLPRADRVYSWGVLHHTGAMWDAFRNSLNLVTPGGLFCVALYNAPRRVQTHMRLKRVFNRVPRPVRPLMTVSYGTAVLGMLALRERVSPVRHVRSYGSGARGMSYWRDQADWLGGLPCEFADVESIRAAITGTDFELASVIQRGPAANNEYLLRRQPACAA